MIDYIEWAKEYEEEAERVMQRANELIARKETEKLSLDDIHELNTRIDRLISLYHEHRLTAKHLRER